MKIFAVIHNYGDPEPDALMGEGEPIWYEMPDSSLLRSGNPFFVPDFDTEFQLFPSLCLRMGRLGKGFAPRFSHRYVDGWTAAAAVVATELLSRCRQSGLPWCRAVAFDRSCIIGNLQPFDTLVNYGDFSVECGQHTINYRFDHFREPIERIVAALSADNTIKNGDLALVALTPRGIPLQPGSHLSIKANNLNLTDVNIK